MEKVEYLYVVSANSERTRIQRVKIEKETAQSYFINGRYRKQYSKKSIGTVENMTQNTNPLYLCRVVDPKLVPQTCIDLNNRVIGCLERLISDTTKLRNRAIETKDDAPMFYELDIHDDRVELEDIFWRLT